MNWLFMCLAIVLATAIGSFVPVFFGQPYFGGWSILSAAASGIIAVFIHLYFRKSGYIE